MNNGKTAPYSLKLQQEQEFHSKMNLATDLIHTIEQYGGLLDVQERWIQLQLRSLGKNLH